MTDLEKWHRDGESNGWRLPPPAPRLLRLPIVRHVRVAWNWIMIERHYAICADIGFGIVRTGYDEWVLWAMARGLC